MSNLLQKWFTKAGYKNMRAVAGLHDEKLALENADCLVMDLKMQKQDPKRTSLATRHPVSTIIWGCYILAFTRLDAVSKSSARS